MTESLWPTPTLTRAHFSFIQDPNSLGTTDKEGVGSEDLEVFLEYQMPGDEGEAGRPFIVIQSTSGWSVSDVDELVELVDRCSRCHYQFQQMPKDEELSVGQGLVPGALSQNCREFTAP